MNQPVDCLVHMDGYSFYHSLKLIDLWYSLKRWSSAISEQFCFHASKSMKIVLSCSISTGQSRRFQPNKPLTKAQAAVALTSGRMTETVNNEILRLEAENSSRQVAMKEIRSEVLDKGDIERFWDEKMKEERARGLEIQNLYIAALRDLEFEKTVEEKALADHLKGKAAMDCQRQLLLGLKEEVDEMSERLTSERSTYVDEQCNLQELLSELQTKQEVMRDKKSVAEAEIEALRILR